jgi:valyl-tRNA synthetase
MDDFSVESMLFLQSVIAAVRALRKEAGVEEKISIPIEVKTGDVHQEVITANRDIVERLARVSEIRFTDTITSGLAKHHTAEYDITVVYERKIDTAAAREKKLKEIARLEQFIANSEAKLNNPGFTSKAPAHIIEGLKKQIEENKQLLDKARRDLDGLGG